MRVSSSIFDVPLTGRAIQRCGRHSNESEPQYFGWVWIASVLRMTWARAGMVIVLPVVARSWGVSPVDLMIPGSGLYRRRTSS